MSGAQTGKIIGVRAHLTMGRIACNNDPAGVKSADPVYPRRANVLPKNSCRRQTGSRDDLEVVEFHPTPGLTDARFDYPQTAMSAGIPSTHGIISGTRPPSGVFFIPQPSDRKPDPET